MRIVFELECSVETWLEERGRVAMPRPSRCPACGHCWVVFYGWWPRYTRHGRVDIRRVACRAVSCKATHSLLPDVLVAGCGDLVGEIGQALERNAAGQGHRPITAVLAGSGAAGLSPSTVRRWLRRVSRCGLEVARVVAAQIPAADPAGEAGRWRAPVPGDAGRAGVRAGSAAEADQGVTPSVRAPPADVCPVVVLVEAVHAAAQALGGLSGEPVDAWRYAVRITAGRLLG